MRQVGRARWQMVIDGSMAILIGERPGRLVTYSLEILDVFQLLQTIEDCFLDEVVQHHPMLAAVPVKGVFEGAVDASVDLYRGHFVSRSA